MELSTKASTLTERDTVKENIFTLTDQCTQETSRWTIFQVMAFSHIAMDQCIQANFSKINIMGKASSSGRMVVNTTVAGLMTKNTEKDHLKMLKAWSELESGLMGK